MLVYTEGNAINYRFCLKLATRRAPNRLNGHMHLVFFCFYSARAFPPSCAQHRRVDPRKRWLGGLPNIDAGLGSPFGEPGRIGQDQAQAPPLALKIFLVNTPFLDRCHPEGGWLATIVLQNHRSFHPWRKPTFGRLLSVLNITSSQRTPVLRPY